MTTTVFLIRPPYIKWYNEHKKLYCVISRFIRTAIYFSHTQKKDIPHSYDYLLFHRYVKLAYRDDNYIPVSVSIKIPKKLLDKVNDLSISLDSNKSSIVNWMIDHYINCMDTVKMTEQKNIEIITKNVALYIVTCVENGSIPSMDDIKRLKQYIRYNTR